jgi:signal transduction histidine kinase
LISHFFEMNKMVVLIAYPLVFFLMGFGILLKNRRHSQFHLAKSLHYMAFYGLLHSFADWGEIYIPLQMKYLSTTTIHLLESIQIILEALSFSFLFYFGIHLLQPSIKWGYKILALPSIIFFIWIVFFNVQTFFLHQNLEHSLIISIFLSKCLITIPGGILSSIAIYLQRKQFEEFGIASMTRTISWASISIFIYTLTTGFISPHVPAAYHLWLSYDQFEQMTGIPIEFFRGLSGAVISFFILRILKVVDIEYQQYFYQAEHNKVVTEERNRIARDLHDGMIQSIFATGLRLEGVRHMLNNGEKYEVDQSLTVLQEVISKLNDLMGEIRRYIRELQMPLDHTSKLEEELRKLIHDMNVSNSLTIAFYYRYQGSEPALSLTIQIFYIIKEALSNILKHSQASHAAVSIDQDETDFIVKIEDNGKGFQPEDLLVNPTDQVGGKHGVGNMEYRAKTVGGTFSIHSTGNQGTIVELRIKLWKLKGRSNHGK